MEPKIKKKPMKFDAFGRPVGMPEITKDLYNMDKSAKDGPQGGPSFTSGSDQGGMPGSSTGEAACYNAGIGQPGDAYEASWGQSTTREGSLTRISHYTGVVLDEPSRTALLAAVQDKIPQGWDVVAHHMTVNMGAPQGVTSGAEFDLTAVAFGIDDKVAAVQVETDAPSNNSLKHITVAVNRAGGGKPFMSNKLQKWDPIPSITLKGIVAEENKPATREGAWRIGMPIRRVAADEPGSWESEMGPLEDTPEKPAAESLQAKLEKYGIPVNTWGQGATKTLQQLEKEIANGESEIVEENGTITRRVSVLTIDVFYVDESGKTMKLKEQKQVFKSGDIRERQLSTSMAEKLKSGEQPNEAAVKRAIAEELGITGKVTISAGQPSTADTSSPSYPGLPSQMQLHQFSATITGADYKAGYVEVQKDKSSYFVWEDYQAPKSASTSIRTFLRKIVAALFNKYV